MMPIKTREKYLSENRTDRSSGVQTVTTMTKQNDGGGSRARSSEREGRMLGLRPKDANDSKGRDGTLGLRMQGPSMRMCEVAMMRVFIDKCVVMVVEITKAKRTRKAESGLSTG